MKILDAKKKTCLCCMEEHEVKTVCIEEQGLFKGEQIEYYATYEYCEKADEYEATGEMMVQNDINMKNAYRTKVGLLTTSQIEKIRRKYGISQSDLSALLGWGGKTITRYEGHHVQDAAHDYILRKIDTDPEWFLALLEDKKEKFSPSIYMKYRNTAVDYFEKTQDQYLRKAIKAQYARYSENVDCAGGVALNLEKIIDVVCYFAARKDVSHLFKVKLMKMLWYADNLSFKRRGHSMMGLVYKALPMGAVPIAHESLIDLKGIIYEEIDFEESSGYLFKPNNDRRFDNLTEADKSILNEVIRVCGNLSRKEIVEKMHMERAYIETAKGDIIQYQYAKELSLE